MPDDLFNGDDELRALSHAYLDKVGAAPSPNPSYLVQRAVTRAPRRLLPQGLALTGMVAIAAAAVVVGNLATRHPASPRGVGRGPVVLTTPAQPTATASPRVTPPPRATPAVPRGPTRITLSGAITGDMLSPVVQCGLVPTGGGYTPTGPQPQTTAGFMSVTGTVAGRPVTITVWGAAKDKPNELYEGPAPGQIDYIAPDVAGIAQYDWAGGAVINADLPPMSSKTGTLRVTGTITCGR